MNYRITCVCGHQFQVSDGQVRTELECPVCHQRLKPAVETPAPPPTAPQASAPQASAPQASAPQASAPQASAPQVSAPPAAGAWAPVPPANSVTSAAPPGGAAEPTATPPVSAASASAADAPPVHTAFEPTKRCPFCGEVILAIARKCKHCGEFLDRTVPAAAVSAAHTGAITPGTPAAALAPNAAIPAAPVPSSSDPVYSLNSSQWDNFWRFVILGATFLFLSIIFYFIGRFSNAASIFLLGTLGTLVICGFIGWFYYLRTHSTHIRIYPFRIDVESGILSKSLESLELFRITDTELKQSLIERMVGIGTINLMTNDSTSEPELTLLQIPRAREVLKYLQVQIPASAKQRGAVYLEK